MLPVTGELNPTASYKRRWWTWVPIDDPAALAIGRLTISLQKGVRPGCKVESDCYGVDEVPCVGFIGREFQLANLTDLVNPNVYRVRIGVREHDDTCTCDAGQVGRYVCKHVDTLRAILVEGCIPDPREFPADFGPTEAEWLEVARG